MVTVRVALAALVVALAAPTEAQSVADWRPYIVEASAKFGVPTSWIEQVMQAESKGHTLLRGRPIRSRAGAIGLMQLMPGTWADMRARLGLGLNPDDPRDNILAGTLYLRLMYDRFGYPGLFAAYNAGPARYADHLAGRRTLPAETVAYLASVAPLTGKTMAIGHAKALPPPSIFAVRHDDAKPIPAAPHARAASLFVALSKSD